MFVLKYIFLLLAIYLCRSSSCDKGLRIVFIFGRKLGSVLQQDSNKTEKQTFLQKNKIYYFYFKKKLS